MGLSSEDAPALTQKLFPHLRLQLDWNCLRRYPNILISHRFLTVPSTYPPEHPHFDSVQLQLLRPVQRPVPTSVEEGRLDTTSIEHAFEWSIHA